VPKVPYQPKEQHFDCKTYQQILAKVPYFVPGDLKYQGHLHPLADRLQSKQLGTCLVYADPYHPKDNFS